jgi:ABC-2 type transport system ATP-binding protein
MNTNPVITTTGLIRRFGDLTAVDRLDLDVPEGSIYGFLGPNGAGKTTTIRMLLGLLRPDAGEVRLFGRPLRRAGPASRTRRSLLAQVGAMVEAPSLYPHLTGRENLEVTRRLVGNERDSIAHALEIVRLEEAADRLVRGYSTGMRQRLGLALTLLRGPRLLILDEPTNGLDPAGIQEMRALIRRLPAEWGATVFLSSHLLAEVEQVATHVGILRQGRLVYQGALSALTALDPHLVLGVDRPDQARQALAANGWPVLGNGGSRLTVSANGPSDAAAINACLVGQGLNVYHLQLEQPTLEDVFIKLTGPGYPGSDRRKDAQRCLPGARYTPKRSS